MNPFGEAPGVKLPSAPKTSTPFTRLEAELEAAEAFFHRASALVDRLLGSVPMPVSGTDSSVGENGVLDRLEQKAHSASCARRAASDQLDRLQSVLS